jgi:hypothetical protein
MITFNLSNPDDVSALVAQERHITIKKFRTPFAIAAEQVRRARCRNSPNEEVAALKHFHKLFQEAVQKTSFAGFPWFVLSSMQGDEQKPDYTAFVREAAAQAEADVLELLRAVVDQVFDGAAK